MAKRGNGEGSIYPVRGKDGKVKGYRAAYVVHTAEGTKRRYLSGKRRQDVRDKLAKALSDRVDGLVIDAGALTVGEYLNRWLKNVKGTVRRSTYERHDQLVRLHIRPALARIKLKNLTTAQVRWFYRERLESSDPLCFKGDDRSSTAETPVLSEDTRCSRPSSHLRRGRSDHLCCG